MSRDDVELVRRAVGVWVECDQVAMAEIFAPDVSHRAIEGAIDDVGEMHGLEAIRRYAQEWEETFDDFAVVVEDARDLGGGRVVTAQRASGRAKLSGLAAEITFGVVYEIRDGRIVRGREYATFEEALEAAGA